MKIVFIQVNQKPISLSYCVFVNSINLNTPFRFISQIYCIKINLDSYQRNSNEPNGLYQDLEHTKQELPDVTRSPI